MRSGTHFRAVKRLGVAALMTVSTLSSPAVSKNEENFEFTKNRASINGLLTSSDSWQLELGYHYMLCRYFGIGASAGAWKVYFGEGYASGKNWTIDSDDTRPQNLYLHPSIVLKSPALKIGQVDLGLYAEPGMMMNVPYTMVWIQKTTIWPAYDLEKASTNKGQWCAWDVRAGVYANIGPCGFSAGYMMSNFDVYSQYRHLSYEGTSFREFYPRKPSIQGAYLSLSYYF